MATVEEVEEQKISILKLQNELIKVIELDYLVRRLQSF